MDADGLLWWSTPAATVGLVVVGGTVVDCPPYAATWARNRDARDLWRQGKRQGADLVWLPAPPQRPVEHYWNGSWGTMMRRDVRLSTNGQTWQVQIRDGRTEGVLRYPDEAQARQQMGVLLGEGDGWRSLSVD